MKGSKQPMTSIYRQSLREQKDLLQLHCAKVWAASVVLKPLCIICGHLMCAVYLVDLSALGIELKHPSRVPLQDSPWCATVADFTAIPSYFAHLWADSICLIWNSLTARGLVRGCRGWIERWLVGLFRVCLPAVESDMRYSPILT